MPFHAKPTRGTSYIFLVGDLAAILNSLEIDDRRSGYQQGYMEALRRVAAAVSVAYDEELPDIAEYFIVNSEVS